MNCKNRKPNYMTNRLLISFLLTAAASFAQTDSVYLCVKSGLIPEYSILLEENGTHFKEEYTAFKGRTYLVKKSAFQTAVRFEGKVFEEKSGRKISSYKQYAACDPEVSLIRNGAYYWDKQNGIDSYGCEKSKPITFGGFGSRIDIDYMHGDHFIRVVYNSQNAGIIYVGAKIRLTSNRMYVRDTADKCWPFHRGEAHPVQVFQKK